MGCLLIAFSKVDFGGFPSDWWWYIASSACELVLYKLPAYSSFAELHLFVDCCFMCNDMVGSGGLYSGTIHRPVLMHLLLFMIILTLYRTSTPIPHFVNDNSHPASQSFTTEMSEYDAKSGMI